jgi:hypothetical protein
MMILHAPKGPRVRKSNQAWRTLICSGALITSVASSCVDTTPVVVADNSQWIIADAGESACLQCQQAPDDPGPGCATELAECYAHASCKATAECAIQTGCYNLGNAADWTSCAIACGEKYKLGEDPDALGAAYANFNCFQRTCGKACNPNPGD